ncbi:lytic transglycosylase domain-containing protein [Micromonospora echinaurantiaca]|uniref:lytic transglycosylase domain-containing protein n=1 Tax=Micromonospora echinaurantiaca TaxID=47857 RepID=UPI0034168F59
MRAGDQDRPGATDAPDAPDAGAAQAAGDPTAAATAGATGRADAATTMDGGAATTGSDSGPDAAARPDGGADTATTKPGDSADTATTKAGAGADGSAAEAGDGPAKPGDSTTKPSDSTAKPSDSAAKPGDSAAKLGDSSAKPGDSAGEPDASGGDATSGRPAGARRRRVPFAHAVRQPPHRVALAAARATRAWSRRSSGRLTLPGVFLLALVLTTAAAGALVVPAAVRAPRPVAADDSATATPPPAQPGLPGTPLPTGVLPPGGTLPTGPAAGPVATGRPADALAAWAQQVGPKVGISPVAMQAYGYAELVLAETNRSCGLSWTTLAAIGFVESGHGQANNARLGPDGRALPEIIGLPLDGQGGRMRITDTDRGQLDQDTTYDRAIGPMQFIPTTWQEIGADADGDGRKDPHDLDDAALAAGNYLCKGGRNLTIPGDWWNAILSYNDVRRYAQDVFDTANRYGQASRT